MYSSKPLFCTLLLYLISLLSIFVVYLGGTALIWNFPRLERSQVGRKQTANLSNLQILHRIILNQEINVDPLLIAALTMPIQHDICTQALLPNLKCTFKQYGLLTFESRLPTLEGLVGTLITLLFLVRGSETVTEGAGLLLA